MPETTATERQRRCAHERFVCKADVGRLTEIEGGPVTGYCVDVRILCDECGLPFRWRGVEAGYSVHEPKVSVDGLDLRAPLEPAYVTEIMGMPLKAGTA